MALLKDRECSGRPAVVDDDQILTLIENNPRHTTRDIAEILHISYTSVKAFEDIRVHKSLRCLSASQFDGKKFNGHFHLRFFAQTQQK